MSDPLIPGGYILLSRKLIDSGIMKKPPEYLKVWIYLLSKAYFTPTGNLQRGQGFVSIPELIDVLSYNVGYRVEKPTKKQVFGILEWLRNPDEGIMKVTPKEPMIVTTKVTHGLLYTIVKYDLYQSPDNYEGNTESNDEGSTKVQRRERQGNNINKNDKEDKNDKEYKEDIYGPSSTPKVDLKSDDPKNKYPVFEAAWQLYPEKIGKNKVKDTRRKEIEKIGLENMKLAIERYLEVVDFKRSNGFADLSYQNGSTFFNGSYADFLTNDYQSPRVTSITKNNFDGKAKAADF